MRPIKKGTAVRYFPFGPSPEIKAKKPPWRIEKHYGGGIYLIGSKTEFCDLVLDVFLKVSGPSGGTKKRKLT